MRKLVVRSTQSKTAQRRPAADCQIAADGTGLSFVGRILSFDRSMFTTRRVVVAAIMKTPATASG